MKEKELEDKLEKNLNDIESGLILIKRQKKVSTGIIDLFCKDRNGKYVIIEIKRKPDINVIAQLANYNMALIKNGINKNKLRTILVALEFSKAVKNVCEFFKFEIKKVYKENYLIKEKRLKNKLDMLDRNKAIKFIKRKGLVNQSMIARFLNIYHPLARDLINDLSTDKLITVTNFAGNKFIQLKKD